MSVRVLRVRDKWKSVRPYTEPLIIRTGEQPDRGASGEAPLLHSGPQGGGFTRGGTGKSVDAERGL